MATVVYYSGMVQGVGFRAAAAAVARGYAVRGWVRNLPDGRVELLVDGAPDAVTRYLAHLRDRMRGYIEGEEMEDREAGEVDGFRVIR
jgi:acylphosphatase